MTSLADFILARYAEEKSALEEAARQDAFWAVEVPTDNGLEKWEYHVPALPEVDLLLADVEAKRRIVAEHGPVDYGPLGMDSPNACHICGIDVGMSDWEYVRDSFPCVTLRALALPYADHEDYLEEWKP